MITRVATPDDARALAKLAAHTFPLACPPGTDPADIAEFLATTLSESGFATFLADPTHTTLVAEDSAASEPRGHDARAKPVAYAMLVTGAITDPDVAAVITAADPLLLSKFYALPAQHGNGVARILMDAVLDHARRAGHDLLWLGVNQQNARARGFYAKCGFEVAGTKHFTLGAQVHDDFVMVQQLDRGR